MDATPELQPKVILNRLTSLRGLAAIAVFLYHLTRHTDWLPQEQLFRYGYVGVGFFFVLSGFVLTWSYRPGITIREFYARRFARVYPSHIATLVIALLLPVTAFPITLASLFFNFVLLQAWIPDWNVIFGINAVSWSLSCELFFYFIAPFVIRKLSASTNRVIIIFAVSYFACTSLTSLLLGINSNYLDVIAYANPLLRSGEFILGIATALLVSRAVVRPHASGIALLALFAAFSGLALSPAHLPQMVATLSMTALFVITIAVSANADIAQKRGILTNRFFTYWGEVSFAFYLVHELVIMNLASLLGSSDGTMMENLGRSTLVFLASCIFAASLHHLIEKPLQRRVTKWLK